MNTLSTLLTVVISGGVALIVGLTTALVTLTINKSNQRHEQKLAIFKILLEASYKEYEFITKLISENPKVFFQENKKLSFTEYIIFYREIANLLSNESVTEDEIKESLRRNKKLIDSYYEYREIFKPDYYKEEKKN